MAADGYDRVVQAGDRAVEAPAGRVLDDRALSYADVDGPGGGATPAAPPAIEPPQIVIAIDPGLTPDPALQRCLDDVRNHEEGQARPFRSLRMALVDLTGDPRNPRYAGVWDEEQTEAGSLAKIGIMYAAFQLRDLVQQAAPKVEAKTGAEVLKRLQAAWKPFWEERFPGRTNDSPRLDRIFDVNLEGPQKWKVRFKFEPHGDDQVLDGIYHATSGEKIDFRTRLELMMRWSDNAAARGIQLDLGFQCLNALLADGGFFGPPRGGGLWLSKLYAKDVFWGRDPVGGTVQGATARAVGELLTLLAQDRIVRPGIAAEMRSLMSRGQPLGYGSWLVNGIVAADDPEVQGPNPPKRRVDAYVAKVGFIKKVFGDCALIRRINARGEVLEYVVVVLGATDDSVITKVAPLLDACILARHPPPPPPPPPASPQP